MKKVITYGTFDLFHKGHYNLLKRAKDAGDYLIVGVTSDQYDKLRGKLNVRDSIMKRIENVRNTGFVDEIIVEEYYGQKIDDIQKYEINEFVIGSDWQGKFDYLSEYCKVTYLERTKGISSTEIRNADENIINFGIIGSGRIARRFVKESKYVSGINVNCVYNPNHISAIKFMTENELDNGFDNLELFLNQVDAVYIASPHQTHLDYVLLCLKNKKHVLCEKPFTFNHENLAEIYELASVNDLILMEAIKTAYCPGFKHLVNVAKSGIIGSIKSVDATFTKLIENKSLREYDKVYGGSVSELASYPLLAIAKLLGTDCKNITFYSTYSEGVDVYTKAILQFENAIATSQTAIGYKSEGNLVITGSKGYILVPSPWWLTQEFEVRFEDFNKNMKYYYKYDGDGLRYEISEFVERISKHQTIASLSPEETIFISKIIGMFKEKKNVIEI